jgi:hypothetical protein
MFGFEKFARRSTSVRRQPISDREYFQVRIRTQIYTVAESLIAEP